MLTSPGDKQKKDLIKRHHAELFKRQKAPEIDNGSILTERPHPDAKNFSQIIQANTEAGFGVLKKIEIKALTLLTKLQPTIESLYSTIKAALNNGGFIIVGGCGAAARAAFLVYTEFEKEFPQFAGRFQVIIAGGLPALIRSREGYEDKSEYGRKSLRDLLSVFPSPHNIVIGLSASGKADFTSGMLAETAEQKLNGFLLCCLPDSEIKENFSAHKILTAQVQQRVKILSIAVGEMVIAGSTRGQAATAQILVLGLVIFSAASNHLIDINICSNALIALLEHTSSKSQASLAQIAYKIISQQGILFYRIQRDASPVVALTETTELTPTFTLPGLINAFDKNPSCPYAIPIVDDTKNAGDALRKLIGRELPLEAKEPWNFPDTTLEYLLGFDPAQKP